MVCRFNSYTSLKLLRAQDKVHYPKVPKYVLLCWYCKCYAVVRWRCFVSQQFQILAGVRQGGVFTLFAVFIDSVIKKLRMSGYGAYIGKLLRLFVICLKKIIINKGRLAPLTCHKIQYIQAY